MNRGGEYDMGRQVVIGVQYGGYIRLYRYGSQNIITLDPRLHVLYESESSSKGISIQH